MTGDRVADPATKPLFRYVGRIRPHEMVYHPRATSDILVFEDQDRRQCRIFATDFWGDDR